MKALSNFSPLRAEDLLAFPMTGIHFIEASAGTGKTYTIANLFLRYLFAGKTNDQILVVTFTNAATEELRGRIRYRLLQLLRLLEKPHDCEDHFFRLIIEQSNDPQFRQQSIDRLKLAARSLDEVAIYTIHGFCQRLLQDYAFDCGQPYDVELIVDQNEYWRQAAEDWWRKQTYEIDPNHLSLFLCALESQQALIRLQDPLRALQSPSLRPQIRESLQEFYQQWNRLLRQIQQLAPVWISRSSEITDTLKQSKALSRSQKSPYNKHQLQAQLEKIDAYFSSPIALINVGIVSFLSSDSLESECKPSMRDQTREFRDPFFVACADLSTQIHDLVSRFRIRALVDSVQYCDKHVKQAKQKHRVLTFDDLLIHALHALRETPGGKLVKQLQHRFPVAMIDEFQDTDPVQYAIFRRIYSDASKTVLSLIGDPKQSIYSFRGSDIFSYMQAREDAGNKGFTLDVNRRSAGGLVTAVNALFSRHSAPFIFHRTIQFTPAIPDPERDKSNTPEKSILDVADTPPLVVWKIPLSPSGKPYTSRKARLLLAESTAASIAELFNQEQSQNLKASDIAVLVRTNQEGEMVHSALGNRGIDAATTARDNIFESDEAFALEQLLIAITQPNDQQKLRNALSSSLFAWTYPELMQIWSDEIQWASWSGAFRELNELWRNKGFILMFQHFLRTFGIGERIAESTSSHLVERRLTNFLHLAELLQQGSRKLPSPSSLLAWLVRQRSQFGLREAEPRLESDEDLVHIVTIHSSKGLEYPIVFLPFLWSCNPVRNKKVNLIEFHDRNGEVWLDAGSPEEPRKQAHYQAEKERLAEDLRLLYVALTRARSKIFLAWGPVNSGHQSLSGKTALAYLLHSEQSPDDLDNALPDGFAQGMQWENDLQTLANAANGQIAICDLPNPELPANSTKHGEQPVNIVSRKFAGKISPHRRMTSFTGMTREIHQPPHRSTKNQDNDPILEFPAGSKTGTFMHLILQELNFQDDIEAQTSQFWQQYASRFGLTDDFHRESMQKWLKNVVETRLDGRGLKLRDLANPVRLNELAFDFSVEETNFSPLNRLLNRHLKQPGPKIEFQDFRGFVNGVIDLVFEYQQRYYIVDYKTSYLGGSLADYAPALLHQEMIGRRYDLQYYLYTLALHRYLRQRVRGYSYQEHFGGIYYLFLRAMRPENEDFLGIYQVLPDWKQVQAFHELFPHGTGP